MKRAWIVFLAMMLIAGFAQAELKIGYIDSEKILLDYEESKDALSKLEAQNRRYQEEFQEMQVRYQNLLEEYEKKKFVATDLWKKQKEEEAEKLAMDIQNYQMTKFGPQGEIYKKEAELMAPVLEKINNILKKIGAEGGYDYIIDTAQRSIVFANPKHDLTSVVLYELSKATEIK
ncbi:MAG TPA: OmpH family outer membrane protein [Candidatus Marinimicrobia bacterium]|nr:OmpH family outer membrane protein [Candidatus Neomarinimicrobiota bacterium]